MSSARVVVTGGAGFIGTAVVRELVGRGENVTVVDSFRPDAHQDGDAARRRLETLGARVVEADVRDSTALVPLLRNTSVVVHLAAKVGLGVDLDDMEDYVSSNDLGTAVVLRAAARQDVPRVVQASSMVVYGEGRYTCSEHGVVSLGPRSIDDLQRGVFEPPCPVCGRALEPGLVTEDSPLDPRNTYAATKLAQEYLASTWSRESGGTAVSLRLHNVYGAGMPRNTPYAGVAALFVSRLEAGLAPRVFEDGGQRRDFVHVDDVAGAFAAAAEADTEGHWAINVGSGRVTTVGDMARALADHRGGPSPVVTGEFRLGDVRHITASSDRAAAQLGWRARIPLTEGISSL